jgi:hypothetical protein
MYGERKSDSVRGVINLRAGIIGMKIHREILWIIKYVSSAIEREGK